MKRQTRKLLREAIPLTLREPAGLVLKPRTWFDSHRKSWFIRELLRDPAATDPGGPS